VVKCHRQNTHQWGFHGFGNGRYFAADFCHPVQRMNFELVFGCGAMFCPASFFTSEAGYHNVTYKMIDGRVPCAVAIIKK
jgi:hypothetical protein